MGRFPTTRSSSWRCITRRRASTAAGVRPAADAAISSPARRSGRCSARCSLEHSTPGGVRSASPTRSSSSTAARAWARWPRPFRLRTRRVCPRSPTCSSSVQRLCGPTTAIISRCRRLISPSDRIPRRCRRISTRRRAWPAPGRLRVARLDARVFDHRCRARQRTVGQPPVHPGRTGDGRLARGAGRLGGRSNVRRSPRSGVRRTGLAAVDWPRTRHPALVFHPDARDQLASVGPGPGRSRTSRGDRLRNDHIGSGAPIERRMVADLSRPRRGAAARSRISACRTSPSTSASTSWLASGGPTPIDPSPSSCRHTASARLWTKASASGMTGRTSVISRRSAAEAGSAKPKR